LGKTIEAGFIYQELNARNRLERVLIVCPSGLRHKWQEEMSRKFGEEFQILDSAGIRSFLSRVERLGPGIDLRGICSLQAIRNEGVRGRLEGLSPPFDLVIIDEAHHMRNSGTLSNMLGHTLSQLAEAMLLLTATPIHLGDENLFNLLQILDKEEFDSPYVFDETLRANRYVIGAERIIRQGMSADLKKCVEVLRQVESTPIKERFVKSPIYRGLLNKLESYDGRDRARVIEMQRDMAQLNLLGHIMTRTRKREVSERQPVRQAGVMRVEWSEEEQNLYGAVTNYCRDRIRSSSEESGVAAWFPVITLQRQIASCIPATLRYYCEGTVNSGASLGESELCDIEIEDLTDNYSEQLEIPSLRNDPGLLQILREGAKGILRDSKLEALLKQLQKLDEAEKGRKILIFSYFKKTLEYLHKELQECGYSCVLITGDVPSRPLDPDNDERGRRLLMFRDDPNIRIMLSSEVGSEGLDFQFAHILVNYDLPWNPMVVEQRIGRVDRLGQRSERILIFNFSVPGTIEDRILERLYQRIHIFEQSIGDLESILGNEIRELTLELLRSELTPTEQEERIEHTASVIEHKKQEIADLENHAMEFIGQDAYFHEQLMEISSKHRYITPEELEVLIKDFVSREYPASVFEPSDSEWCFNLRLDKEFARLVRETARDNAADMGFVSKASHPGTRVTCRAEIAYNDSAIELINGQHVLVRSVIAYYEAHFDRLHPVSRIQVNISWRGISSGDYIYFLYLIEQHSANPGKTLEAVFLLVSTGDVVDEDESEKLLSELVTKGETLEAIKVSGVVVDRVHQKAEGILGERLHRRKSELERVNNDIIERRLASVEATYKAKRESVSSMLEQARSEKQDPRIIRMKESQINNIDSKNEDTLRKIEDARRISLQWNLIAAGVVRVVSNA
jgi:superfamily II DNA or RNA helicase/DNA-directed RNA polymerase subunit H (RpoH/RPB5)